MTESIGWILAAVVAALVAAARLVSKPKKAPQMAQKPPEDVGAAHARDAIETAAQRNMGDIDNALKGDDAVGSLARLANLAQKRRF